jgi:hypothetical protein
MDVSRLTPGRGDAGNFMEPFFLGNFMELSHDSFSTIYIYCAFADGHMYGRRAGPPGVVVKLSPAYATTDENVRADLRVTVGMRDVDWTIKLLAGGITVHR